MDASKEIKKKKYNYSLNQLVKKFKFYNINNFDRLMNHEYIFFGKRDKIKILNNFLKTFEFFEENFKKKKKYYIYPRNWRIYSKYFSLCLLKE